MNTKKMNHQTKALFALILAGGVFLVLNFLTPYVADDWSYSGSTGLIDVFRQEYTHYFHTNGRSMAHILARFFLMYPKPVFNLANSIVYVIFTYLIFLHGTYGMKLDLYHKIVCYLLIHLMLFIYVLNWGQVFLWLDGACNYLWTCTWMLFYLLPFRIYFSLEGKEREWISRWWMIPGMLLAGAIAGWCNENTSGGVILLTILFLLYFFLKKRKTHRWMWAGLSSSMITFMIMLLSPGNAHRRTYFVDNRAWYNQLIDHFLTLTNRYWETHRYLLIVFIIVLVFLLQQKMIQDKVCLLGMYGIVSAGICYALAFSPVTGGRPFFGSSIFLILAVILSLACLLEADSRSKIAVNAYFGVLLCFATINFLNGFADIAYYKVHSDRRDAFVKQQRENGYTNLVVNELSPKPKTKYNAAWGLSDLLNDPKDWPSTAYARYYGADTVTAVSNELFEKVFKNGNPELINCRDIYEYLQKINDERYLIVMAVNDDSSGAVDATIVELMRDMGLKTDLRENFRWSYLAVVNQGQVVDEKYANEVLNFYENIDGHVIEVESSGKIYNKGNRASIKIDGYEYARNSLGLNLVVFDTALGRVVDRVTFNTWKGLEASR